MSDATEIVRLALKLIIRLILKKPHAKHHSILFTRLELPQVLREWPLELVSDKAAKAIRLLLNNFSDTKLNTMVEDESWMIDVVENAFYSMVQQLEQDHSKECCIKTRYELLLAAKQLITCHWRLLKSTCSLLHLTTLTITRTVKNGGYETMALRTALESVDLLFKRLPQHLREMARANFTCNIDVLTWLEKLQMCHPDPKVYLLARDCVKNHFSK